MAVVGSTFVELHVVAAGLEKEIAAKVTAAAKAAEKASNVNIKPKVDTKEAEASTGRLAQVMTNLRGKLKSVADEGGPVSSRLAKMAEGATALGPAGLTAALGLAAVVAITAKGVGTFLSLASEIRRFNTLTQAGAENSSRFVIALHELGIEPGRIATALFRLSRQANDTNSALAQSGVQIARNKQGNIDVIETFLNLADAVHGTADAGERNTLVFNAFGRAGAALVPILSRGRGELEQFLKSADNKGLVFSDADLEQARNMQIEMRSLHTTGEGLTVMLGRELVPALNDVLRSILAIADSQPVHDVFSFLATEVRGAAVLISSGADLLSGHYSDALNDVTGHTARAGDAEAEFAQEISEATAMAQRQADELKAVGDSIVGYISAQDAFTSSKRGLINAQQAESDAQDRVNDLMKTHGVDIKAVHSAQDSLRSSTEALTDARRGLAEAEQHLAEVERGATDRELEGSQLGVKQATNALAHAEKELADLRKHHRQDALGVSDAENQVEAAQLSLADANDQLTDTQNKGKVGSKEYEDAQDAVRTAANRVEDATRRQKTAGDELRSAQAGDPDFAKTLARAQSDLAGAHEAVAGAEHAQEFAALKLNDAYNAQQDALAATAASVDDLLASWENLATKFGIPLPALMTLFTGGGDPRVQVTDATSPTASKTGGDPRVSTRGARAGGGPVDAGYWYRINEDGTEFFKPDRSGTVVPIGRSAAASSSGGSVVIQQHFHGTDPEATAQRSGYYVGRALRTAAR